MSTKTSLFSGGLAFEDSGPQAGLISSRHPTISTTPQFLIGTFPFNLEKTQSHILCRIAVLRMDSPVIAMIPGRKPAWLQNAEVAAKTDLRKQPWKRLFPETIPIDLENDDPELVIVTLENQVQKNGKSP
jgi:hypothetical protein